MSEIEGKISQFKRDFQTYLDKSYDPIDTFFSRQIKFIESSERILEGGISLLGENLNAKDTSRILVVLVRVIKDTIVHQRLTISLSQDIIHNSKVFLSVIYGFMMNMEKTNVESLNILNPMFKEIKDKIEVIDNKKELELKIPENIEKELKEWLDERERAKKAQGQYVT